MADADAIRDAGLPTDPDPASEHCPSDGAALAARAPPSDPRVGRRGGEMTLVGHLSELRDRIIRVVIAVAVGASSASRRRRRSSASSWSPLPSDQLHYTGLGDPFVINIKIAIVVGVILAMPVILYQVWSFVAPGPDRTTSAGRPALDPRWRWPSSRSASLSPT